MRRLTQFGIGILLLAATSTLAAEQPLEPGYFKRLLHLGQSPADRILHDVQHGDQLEFFGGEAKIRPAQGEFYDFGDEPRYTPTTSLMIWTEQYSPNGFFVSQPPEGYFIQYYHIYLYSPDERAACLRFRISGRLRIWNNGEMLVDQGSDGTIEDYVDFTLYAGVNSMTLKLRGRGAPERVNYFAVRITDRSGREYRDLQYSLSPPLPEADVRVSRHLPSEYGSTNELPVQLSLEIAPESGGSDLTIIEYIPEGMSVVDPGSGSVIGNSIQWSLGRDNLQTVDISYSLAVPSNYTETMAFLGYVHHDRTLEEIIGDSVLHEAAPDVPWELGASIETVDINASDYVSAENMTVGGEFANDYSGSLENFGRGLVSGLKPQQTGGWAEYEFSVANPGEYHIVLDYGELWTMSHHVAEVSISIDGNAASQTQLFPTTHSYGFPYTGREVYSPQIDPERKAKWIAGSVDLLPGSHRLRMTFPAMYPEDAELDRFTDGRPVITKIFVINYPGFTIPGLAEPHHLDSYEHAPARIVHDRDVTVLSDGRIEMTFYGTFYSLSQGNEIYFSDGYVRPRPGHDASKFDIISMEPSVFHLPPGGEQDFVLAVRSIEPVPDDYSELVIVWLQGAPGSPSRRPYLFTTARSYITLPPYKRREFPWDYQPIFNLVFYRSRKIDRNMTDPAEMFIPDRMDLGFNDGRCTCDPVDFIRDQFLAGNLPSLVQIFLDEGWDYQNPQPGWDRIWSDIMATLYWRPDDPQGGRFPTSNTRQAEAYVKRLAENMVFYPVTRRWDWARPGYIPQVWGDVFGMAALAVHVRTAQEGMIDDNEQFKILHNFVLPIFNSYWDELRTTAILAEDANEGETKIRIVRPFYGDTGSHTNGFNTFIPAYIKIGGDPHSMNGAKNADTIELREPLPKKYPKGTLISSWAFIEEVELESRDVMSLLAIGAASRDWAVVDETMSAFSEILERQKIYLEDGSFRNEPGSYGGHLKDYPEAMLKARRLFGAESLDAVSETVKDKLHNALIYGLEFPFSNGLVPHLNGGGCMNQLNRAYHGDVRMLEELFPEDEDNIALYKHIEEQEETRLPGDIIDNHNFVIHGWGYAMLRSENGSWDRGMETLLSSKYLLSDPGDHVSHDGLGIVVYGLGAILTPRYGYSWIGYLPPFLNQVMVDDNRENGYYGSFWHFDGRKELPCAVAHTGDGISSSELPFRRSRWDIQFPEYLFDAYFIDANDGALHQYDWCFINMGDLDILIPHNLSWQDYAEFLDDYWPEPGTRGAGERTIASKGPGRIIADWLISNGPWDSQVHIDETLLRNPPEHSGRLRLIMADDSPSELINAQIGWYSQANGEQTLANSQDILAVRKNAVSHAFIDTLEPIADDEEAYVKDIVVVERGDYNQQLVKITTIEGEDWVYISGRWGARPSRYQPVPSITTDGDIVTWRVINNRVTRFYLAGGSFADTPHGSWNFGSHGNHYVADNDGG